MEVDEKEEGAEEEKKKNKKKNKVTWTFCRHKLAIPF